MKEERFIGSAKIGSKGQIVIPKEMRDLFGLYTGDSVVLMADRERGIAILTSDMFFAIADTLRKDAKDIKTVSEIFSEI